MIKTPLNKRPQGALVLNASYDCYSAGTRVDFIEYCDITEGVPNSVLGRVLGIQMVVPLEYITERRVRTS